MGTNIKDSLKGEWWMGSERINVRNSFLLVILNVERCKGKDNVDGAMEHSTLGHIPKA